MTVASKLKSGAKQVKTATNKMVRKVGKAIKPVSDALQITGKRRTKPTAAKKSSGPKAARRKSS